MMQIIGTWSKKQGERRCSFAYKNGFNRKLKYAVRENDILAARCNTLILLEYGFFVWLDIHMKRREGLQWLK
jgi:hypothetical protein